MTNSIVIDANDMVATVILDLLAGDEIVYRIDGQVSKIRAASNIPRFHKAAIKPIKSGESVLKYGEKIGCATADIGIGEHVHIHNLTSNGE